MRRAAKDGIDVQVLEAAKVLETAVDREVTGAAAGAHVQLWPHAHRTDGMFLALLRRRS